jgi:uncharacterized membrane protein YgdD (TMEM256/DUF423 family)
MRQQHPNAGAGHGCTGRRVVPGREGRIWLACAALAGFVAVGAGAIGSHLLAAADARAALLVGTASQYGVYHALALVGVAALSGRPELVAERMRRAAGALFVAGIVLFSGSLYVLALAGLRGAALVTPFGGVAFLLGWAALLIGALRARG